MTQEIHTSLLKIEHAIIAFLKTNESESLAGNSKLGELLSERKEQINKRFQFTIESIKEIELANETIAKIEYLTFKRAKAYYFLLSEDPTQICDFETSAFLYHANNFSYPQKNEISLSIKMEEALDNYGRIQLCSYFYVAEEDDVEFHPLQVEYLGNTGNFKNTDWNSCPAMPEFAKVAFCNGWNVLTEQTYYSLIDIIRIKDFLIEISEHCHQKSF